MDINKYAYLQFTSTNVDVRIGIHCDGSYWYYPHVNKTFLVIDDIDYLSLTNSYANNFATMPTGFINVSNWTALTNIANKGFAFAFS